MREREKICNAEPWLDQLALRDLLDGRAEAAAAR
jgi:hypothetical protein